MEQLEKLLGVTEKKTVAYPSPDLILQAIAPLY